MNYQTQFSMDELVGEKPFVDLIRKAIRARSRYGRIRHIQARTIIQHSCVCLSTCRTE